MQLTKHFNISEFACKDGTQVPYNLIDTITELAKNLEVLREYLGVPIIINSAFRNYTYNRKIGSNDNSQHPKCTASDIRTAKYSPEEIQQAIEKLIEEGKMKEGGLGIYKSFIHYDIRGTKARWDER